jgi:hypothetical protein
LLEAKLLRNDKKQSDEKFLYHLTKASECPDVDTNVLSEISDFLEELNSYDAKKLRLKILNILYETDSSLVSIYELGCLYLDGIGTEKNTIEGLRKLKSSFHYEDESVAFLIACTYLTDDTCKDIERSMVWYQIYKDSKSCEEFREEDIALLEDCYQKLDDDLREIIQGKANFLVQLKEMRLKKHAGN